MRPAPSLRRPEWGGPDEGWDTFEGRPEEDQPAPKPARGALSPFMVPERVWITVSSAAEPKGGEPQISPMLEALRQALSRDEHSDVDGYCFMEDAVLHCLVAEEPIHLHVPLAAWRQERIPASRRENNEWPSPDWIADGLDERLEWSFPERLMMYALAGVPYVWHFNGKKSSLSVLSPDAPRADTSWKVLGVFDLGAEALTGLAPFEHAVLRFRLA